MTMDVEGEVEREVEDELGGGHTSRRSAEPTRMGALAVVR